MSKWVYWLGVGVALLALAFVLTDGLLSLLPGPTAANLRHVQKGMTLAEVEALLGGPAPKEDRGDGWKRVPRITPDKDWVDGTSIKTITDAGPATFTNRSYILAWPAVLRSWEGTHGKAEVLFDREGTVMESKFWPREGVPNLRSCFGR